MFGLQAYIDVYTDNHMYMSSNISNSYAQHLHYQTTTKQHQRWFIQSIIKFKGKKEHKHRLCNSYKQSSNSKERKKEHKHRLCCCEQRQYLTAFKCMEWYAVEKNLTKWCLRWQRKIKQHMKYYWRVLACSTNVSVYILWTLALLHYIKHKRTSG